MKEADATDHDFSPEVLSGLGVCGVFGWSPWVIWGFVGILVELVHAGQRLSRC